MKKKHICPHPVFVKRFVHYRTKKVMIASDYGYRVWRLCGCRKRGKK